MHTSRTRVALLTEGVDRNSSTSTLIGSSKVALLTEGVDRNSAIRLIVSCLGMSPSSRRAWIEMMWNYLKSTSRHVALLTEGVDRNAVGR